MEGVVGKIISIRHIGKNTKTNEQMRFDVGASAGIHPGFQKLNAWSISSIQGVNDRVYLIRSFQDGKYITKAFSEMELVVGDIIVTGTGMLCAAEFLLGGRIGFNPASAVCIESERSVCSLGESRRFLRSGGVWSKASNLKEPLEIQTNGGILGIKD
jgi:hypothetical protein